MVLILANIWGWAWVYRKTAITILAIALITLYFAFQWACGTSKLEKDIDSRTPVIIGSNAAVNVASDKVRTSEEKVRTSDSKVVTAQKKLDKAKAEPKANVSLEEANRNRCIAFPESKECQ
jgi:hypothetical protein